MVTLNRLRFAIAGAAAFLLVGAVPAVEAAPPSSPRAGQFRLVYSAAAPEHKRMLQLLLTSKRFEGIVAHLNQDFAVQNDVTVQFAEDEDGPYYREGTIVMNYDFLQYTYDLFKEGYPDQSAEDRTNDVLDVAECVLYHELGHALVDAYDLPVVGKEEDAVDSLSVIISVELAGNDNLALATADLFQLEASEKEEFTKEDFWDEHSLDEQRFYSILCLVYGSDPEIHDDVAKAVEFDDERKDKCADEYERQYASWNKLLAPHLKQR